MRMTGADLSYAYKKQYQEQLQDLMHSSELVNPVFITTRMKQIPTDGTPKLTLDRAYCNNHNFLTRFHRNLLGNNWHRRYPKGLQRFVFVESSPIVGIHSHMLIDIPESKFNVMHEAVYHSYLKTPYSGQPYKHFDDGELVDIRPVYSDGVITYITKVHTKPDFDLAFDVQNSYWMST